MAVAAKPQVQPPDVVALARRRSIAQSVAVVVVLLVAFSIYAVHDGGTQLYVQRVIDGTTNGVLYGAVAVALVLVFKATRVINFSQGAMATLGAFVAFQAYSAWSFPVWAAVLFAMAASAVGAAVLERALIRPFDPDNHLAITIVTLGLFIALNALVGFVWGFDPRGFPSLFPHNVDDFVGLAISLVTGYIPALGSQFSLACAFLVIIAVLQFKPAGLFGRRYLERV